MWGRLGRDSQYRGGGWGGQAKIKRRMRGKRERNREGETEVTRSKLMHGQLSESRRQRKTDRL